MGNEVGRVDRPTQVHHGLAGIQVVDDWDMGCISSDWAAVWLAVGLVHTGSTERGEKSCTPEHQDAGATTMKPDLSKWQAPIILVSYPFIGARLPNRRWTDGKPVVSRRVRFWDRNGRSLSSVLGGLDYTKLKHSPLFATQSRPCSGLRSLRHKVALIPVSALCDSKSLKPPTLPLFPTSSRLCWQAATSSRPGLLHQTAQAPALCDIESSRPPLAGREAL